jgi:hypothetical protein
MSNIKGSLDSLRGSTESQKILRLSWYRATSSNLSVAYSGNLLPHEMSTPAPTDSSFTTFIPSVFSFPISEKLTKSNYSLWQAQVLPAIRATQLEDLLTVEIYNQQKLSLRKSTARPSSSQTPLLSMRKSTARPSSSQTPLMQSGSLRSIGSRVSPLVAHPRSPVARHHVHHLG